MIIGNRENWSKERQFVHPVLRKIIDAVQTVDFSKIGNGRYVLQGDDIYYTVMELNARDVQETRAEKHNTYIDIHFLLDGKETIGWAGESSNLTVVESSKENDYSLYDSAAGEQFLELTPGMYAVFYPHDVHRPGLRGKDDPAPSRIRKAVVKVNKDLFIGG
ncbi:MULTISPECIES: YhcH/YjgK/YiaL family protein [Paenibacillus]|uniref:YhcH/YjgK/YiaL family protein n=1 Tax=Paenibacillus violae TaxID=3077234 RepID=A0ABU3RKV2_9BACL|nr:MULTISPECIES: YhcH/YjgK/YiaL family protein [Paenibacillus]MDU0204721.1 YhcH/YjgK/YiaL family protein [Paenibacillus sp. PFR10]MEC0270586.1 YhcH/YjgK/YiaL family protein [Paenibacillus anseongense]